MDQLFSAISRALYGNGQNSLVFIAMMQPCGHKPARESCSVAQRMLCRLPPIHAQTTCWPPYLAMYSYNYCLFLSSFHCSLVRRCMSQASRCAICISQPTLSFRCCFASRMVHQ